MDEVSQMPDLARSIAGWKDGVNQARIELSQMDRRLEKEAGRLNTRALLAKVERFQNQFICHREVADELFHDLKQAAKRPEAAANGAAGPLSDRMETFLRLFGSLKSEFNQFIENPS